MEKVGIWCTYSFWGRKIPQNLGRVIELNKSKTTGYILYSEGQLYPAECWDMSYVAMFDKIEDAIFYLATQGMERESIHQIREYFNFSKTVKEEGVVIDWERLLELERNYYDKKIDNGFSVKYGGK
ncbi:MAG: hypothetical protein WC333_00555 [Dehalococcoidia bacterium]|jgi:hypothetical protein